MASAKSLIAGTNVALRLWEHDTRERDRIMHSRSYETVGYVLEGHARLHLGAQIVALGPGDSYVVPVGAEHSYEVTHAPFRAIEAIAPPPHADDE